MQFNDTTSVDVDETVRTAEQQAMESGRITPLLKVELWAKIQSRRLSEGKNELEVEFKSPPRRELTEHDEARIKDRRESNRVAALKCRRKRKQKKQNMEKLREELELRNRHLKEQLKYLETEKKKWITKFLEIPSIIYESDDKGEELEDIGELPAKINIDTEIDDEELCNLYYINSSQEVPTTDNINNRAVSTTGSVDGESPLPPDDNIDWLSNESFISLDKYIM